MGVQGYYDRVREQQIFVKQLEPVSEDLRALHAREQICTNLPLHRPGERHGTYSDRTRDGTGYPGTAEGKVASIQQRRFRFQRHWPRLRP